MPTPEPLTSIPESLECGNSTSILLSYSDYPVGSWTLTLALNNGDTQTTNVTATTSGSNFLLTLTSAITNGLAPGEYMWATYATASGQRRTCDTGRIHLLPNLAAPIAKTFAQTQVEQLQEVMGIFNSTDRMSVKIGTGIEYTRANVNDYRRQLVFWEAKVAAEKAALAARRGEASTRRISIEFA